MTRFHYYTATTLDGFIADEGDSLDWLLTQPIDEEGPMNYSAFFGTIGAMAMGATTYEWVVDHEIRTGNPWPYDIPTFVFTHRDVEPVADSIRIVAGPVVDRRDELVDAAGDEDFWVVGGGDLAGQFAEAGMLDEVHLSYAPVTLGSGRPLFPRAYDLELIDLDRNKAFACARYAVVGPRDAPQSGHEQAR
ncbi:hypothetical protein GS4_26_01020 [Gordonia soli NBRC 108243]|uniref:Bacterial bifunctional deaminase-reductase C-terminal domain-containing protein n=1 Tax=Gordonia soli NBRC 108243 TaxID=1223545 RepID=M0QMK2_9ACTN|nr:hypothetical protein GS4_26_01020 [Gordonia soli NBRC 108243]